MHARPAGSRSSRSYPRKGFTLVELLVAVSILAIGIVGVLRSFLNAVAVLDNLNNRLAAVQALEARVNALTAFTLMGTRDLLADTREDIDLRGRKASFQLTASPWGDKAPAEDLSKVTMSLAWHEGNAIKDETFIFILPVNK